jgi:hypothetical protein
MALQKRAEIFIPQVAASIKHLPAIIPNEVRDLKLKAILI